MTQHKLLVANRGEIACRVIRAARRLALPTVAVHSDADSELPHVTMADEAVVIGPARASESYLRGDKLVEVARATGATLVHPGYGFLAENAGFAARCHEHGLVFVGPSPEVMVLMGDKERARQAARNAGVPVLPGSAKLELSDPAVIARIGGDVGYPLLVKAAAGGGGIGMRVVNDSGELLAAVEATSALAAKAFSDGSVYLERMVTRARHVEIQVLGFGDGTAVHLFERDCSLQRRHQKVVEESRAPGVPASMANEMARAAVQLARACRYQGAGTVEFLLDTWTSEFFFLEMNTRIQVEHPVTEMLTATDLVAAQLRLAMGYSPAAEWKQDGIHANGHALEVRVYAENPAKNFMPSPGRLQRFRIPELPDVRFESGYREGNAITPFYDPLVMKVIARDGTREAALERLDDALARVEIDGIRHNVGYLRAILRNRAFRAGDVHIGLLAQEHATLLGG